MNIDDLDALYQNSTGINWKAGSDLDKDAYAVSCVDFDCWIPQGIDDSECIAAMHNAWPLLHTKIKLADKFIEVSKRLNLDLGNDGVFERILGDVIREYEAIK